LPGMPAGDFEVVCVPWQLHVSSRDKTGDDHGPQPGVIGAILSDQPPGHGNAVPAGTAPGGHVERRQRRSATAVVIVHRRRRINVGAPWSVRYPPRDVRVSGPSTPQPRTRPVGPDPDP
jgi:hypothetical protein